MERVSKFEVVWVLIEHNSKVERKESGFSSISPFRKEQEIDVQKFFC